MIRNYPEHSAYAEVPAQYRLQAEAECLNADYLDHGATIRRHVRMTGTHDIGKELHDWECQAALGLNLHIDIGYGKHPPHRVQNDFP